MGRTLTLEIPDTVYQALAEMAQQEGKTPEEMGAQWIAASIERIQSDPLEKFIGAFPSDIPDWADRHDEYLGEGLMKEVRGESGRGEPNA